MALRWYRGIEFVKDYTVQYFNYIFMAEERGLIKFWDGTRKAEFSSRPYAVKKNSWDFRSLPRILVSCSNGKIDYITFQKDIVYEENATSEYREYGGKIKLTVDLDIYATTLEERDKLTDIVMIYLSGPTAKDYFEYHAIVLPAGPTMREAAPRHEPKIDHPIYVNTISFQTISDWRDREEANHERLIDIIVYLQNL